MDSTTLLGLAGIGGMLLGTAVGAAGTLGAARVTSRGQADVAELKARWQAYSACATALLARRDAAIALLETFPEDSFDPAAVQAPLQNLDEQRDGVARAVGAVAVEGPDAVAHSAEYAAYAIEVLAGRPIQVGTALAGDGCGKPAEVWRRRERCDCVPVSAVAAATRFTVALEAVASPGVRGGVLRRIEVCLDADDRASRRPGSTARTRPGQRGPGANPLRGAA